MTRLGSTRFGPAPEQVNAALATDDVETLTRLVDRLPAVETREELLAE